MGNSPSPPQNIFGLTPLSGRLVDDLHCVFSKTVIAVGTGRERVGPYEKWPRTPRLHLNSERIIIIIIIETFVTRLLRLKNEHKCCYICYIKIYINR